MKIGLLQEPFRFTVEEVPLPEVGAEEVRVRVAACGICGTDLNAYIGKAPRGWKIVYPFRMGHELAGVVDAVGEKVPAYADLKVGDHVVPDGRLPCHVCHYCRRGQFNLCLNMGYTSGGFSQYSVYPYRNLVKIPAGVVLEHAAFSEPLACVVNGNSQLVDVPIGGYGLIIGAGPIGLLHQQVLKLRGLRVATADFNELRLGVAGELGADRVIDVSKSDLAGEVKAFTGGHGADVIITAAGGDETVIDKAIEVSAKRGQIVYFGAVLKERMSVNLDPIHYRETRLVGSHDSTIAQYETALSLLASGAVNVAPIISHRFELENIGEAFKFAETRKGIKVMVVNKGVS